MILTELPRDPDPEYSSSEPDTIIHADAERPSIALNKAGLQRLFQEFAFGLRNRFGVGANGRNKDVVVLFSTGQVALPAAFLGVICAGGVASMASGSYTAFEVARQIRQGGAKILITSEDLLEAARDAASQITERKISILVLRTEPDFSLRIDGQGDEGELRGWGLEDRLPWERITDRVMLSHRNFVAQAACLSGLWKEMTTKAAALGQNLTNSKLPPERYLAHLPAAHIAGVGGYMIIPVSRSRTIFWMKKYNWPDFLRYNKALKITGVYTVPSIYLRIAKDPSVTDHFRTLFYAVAGSSPMDSALQKAATKKVGTGNKMISQGYGLSETTGGLTAPFLSDKDHSGSIGSALPNVEIRIVDGNDDDVPSGTPGELICRGPVIIKGYFRNPKATEAAFKNGWFYTGDVAIERDGAFYIVDRIKELIKYKGAQIAPAEIEGLLDTHPAVLEAAVCGIPDPSEGASSGGAAHSEIPRAYVIRQKDAKVTEEELKEFVKSKLAAYKQLRGGVFFVDELPKNGTNKLLRRELRERALKEIRRAEGAKL
ncbi:4-coumarate-CoA ligase [Venturia nashicola]|nr:4-coumarate-CoA ligase [Venturia nashicola]